jgi:hypothetical protein
MIYYYIRFILLISLIGCSLTLTAQDIDSEAVVLEDDSDSMNSDNSEDRVEDDGLEDENFDADDSEGFMDEDESEELDFESDEQSKSTDPTSIKLIDLHLKALGGVENLKAINSLKMEGEFREGKKMEYDLVQ